MAKRKTPALAPFALIVLDIDNTVFDWVKYYVHSFGALLDCAAKIIGVKREVLAKESKAVFGAHGSIEYPFLLQELPSVNHHYGADIDRMLMECVEPAREAFKTEALKHLVPYAGVTTTLEDLKREFPHIPRVALTDAPRYVAMWKLNKLGLLHALDAVYGLPDPRLPTSPELGRVKVNPRILLKHLQQHQFDFRGRIRILPDDYEKPGTRGLKTVLMDFELDESPTMRHTVLWVGDNLKKDVGLGRRLGVTTAWAEYGAHVPAGLLKTLHTFSPEASIHKNVSLAVGESGTPHPDFSFRTFDEILPLVRQAAASSKSKR